MMAMQRHGECTEEDIKGEKRASIKCLGPFDMTSGCLNWRAERDDGLLSGDDTKVSYEVKDPPKASGGNRLQETRTCRKQGSRRWS